MEQVEGILGITMINKYPDIEEMIGITFNKVEQLNDDELRFHWDKGTFVFYHQQNCCEGVYIESIVGDLSDLEGTPLLVAEESTDSGDTEYGSETWTFYKFATIKGYVDVRWYGESNGYYSESVDLKYNENTN